MTKKKKVMLAVFVPIGTIVLLIGLLILGLLIPIKASWYTTEEHIERISKKVETGYLNDETGYTDFEVFPLYNEDEEVEIYLVEFAPSGFMYVLAKNRSLIYGSMYLRANIEDWWRRYIVEIGTDSYYGNDVYEDTKWEVDENGNYIDYYDSPYEVACIADEKRYLLNIKQDGTSGHIPAVKKGDNYLNLISMEEFVYQKELDAKVQSYVGIGFPTVYYL